MKKWIDPRTEAELVVVNSAGIAATLLETIDAESVPKRYGGKYGNERGTIPVLDNGLKGLLGVDELPNGPLKWTVDQQRSLCALAVGGKEGDTRREVVANLGA